ncbi:MAG: isocitrate/isopropylmalate family dehydrogenase [Candidatus Dormibacteria bacterium]
MGALLAAGSGRAAPPAPPIPIQLLVLGGDGIGPEVTACALRVLDALAPALPRPVAVTHQLLGVSAYRELGHPAPPEVLRQAAAADAVLMGAVDTLALRALGAASLGSAIVGLRRALGCFAGLRPVRTWSDPTPVSPLPPERLAGVDCLFVRELAAGAYGRGRHDIEGPDGARQATDSITYTEPQVIRVARIAFSAAQSRRGHVTSVDMSHRLSTSRLWRAVVQEVATNYPEVTCEHRLAGDFARDLMWEPAQFDVVLTSNLLGDILSDEAAALAGSLGVLPSASCAPPGRPWLYEPVHGAAPQLVGTGRANPVAAILTLALLLQGQGAPAAAGAIEAAIAKTMEAGIKTPDLGGTATTDEVTNAVLAGLSTALPSGKAELRQPSAGTQPRPDVHASRCARGCPA